jgi:hypothetical protein
MLINFIERTTRNKILLQGENMCCAPHTLIMNLLLLYIIQICFELPLPLLIIKIINFTANQFTHFGSLDEHLTEGNIKQAG